jgi:aspartyl-tRNA(Asn)/glutamyl-tRNA(Gln) amidotransferase subunit B
MSGAYEAVIGIECHVELTTVTKMFCGCPNSFGGEPNTKVCPVCLGMPGALPVPNARALEAIVTTGLAFGSEIPSFSKFDRKNYFYPDMPKDYQISQYDAPLTQGGRVPYRLEDGTRKECRLTRIHLEEDTGKSSHAGSGDGRIAGSSYTLLDFNRAGVPLMECVSEPDIRSAAEAVAFLQSLRRTLRQDGGRLAALRCQRFGEACRHGRARNENRDQEHELVPIGGARDRERDKAADPDSDLGRPNRAGDARLGRG